MPLPPIAEILHTHSPELFRAAVDQAVELLQAGEVVGLPTETVYGLAANALNESAVRKIFTIKGRPAHNPLIVHVASLAMAKRCVSAWPAAAEKLGRAFWPGPLTLVLPRSEIIPDSVTAGGATVGLRWPSHPFMQEVIRRCEFPLAAPSANRSNELSPTTAGHVAKSLGEELRLIVDGGASQVGIESTVVDMTGKYLRILRPGIIHPESITALTGLTFSLKDEVETRARGGPLRSPGLLEKHYAPRTPLRVLPWRDEDDLRNQLERMRQIPNSVQIIAHTCIPTSGALPHVAVIPRDAEAFARALYAELHRCDEMGASLIVIEALPEGSEWEGIQDRLRRASCPSLPDFFAEKSP